MYVEKQTALQAVLEDLLARSGHVFIIRIEQVNDLNSYRFCALKPHLSAHAHIPVPVLVGPTCRAACVSV